MYRGKPTIKIRVGQGTGEAECEEKPQDNIQVFQMPTGTTLEGTLQFLQDQQQQQQE